jgi:hypothetical protein
LFEEEKNLVLCYLQRPEPIVLPVDRGKAEDLAVPVSSAINISDIKASFANTLPFSAEADTRALPSPKVA